MNTHPLPTPARPTEISHHAMGRMLMLAGEPFLFADWERPLMLHYEIDPEVLRAYVPFPLDLHEGKAYVSLVAFTLRDMRPRRGGRWGRWLLRPIASHRFLNVRTYVRVNGEPGIYFITEYMNNLLSLKLGPLAFGLPYRFARLDYRHDGGRRLLAGKVSTPGRNGATFTYAGWFDSTAHFAPAESDTLTEWLMERYTAFTIRRRERLFFRVWHPPWLGVAADIKVTDDSLLRHDLPWFHHARLVGANFSTGVRDVWMGRPRFLPA